MLRFFAIIFMAQSITPVSIKAEELTSFEFDGKEYNLIILEQSEFKEPVSRIQSALQNFMENSEITKCSLVIDVPVGVARGNNSYGGVCELKAGDGSYRALNTMICADEMVRYFAFDQLSNLDTPLELLAEFVVKSCYGG